MLARINIAQNILPGPDIKCLPEIISIIDRLVIIAVIDVLLDCIPIDEDEGVMAMNENFKMTVGAEIEALHQELTSAVARIEKLEQENKNLRMEL